MRVKNKIVWTGGEIYADIARIKALQENQIEKSLVYGSLTFDQLKQIGTKVNLACIAISVGDVTSENIYVDSVAHVMPDAYMLDKESTKVPVYWKMGKRIDSTMAGAEPRLLLKKDCALVSK